MGGGDGEVGNWCCGNDIFYLSFFIDDSLVIIDVC